MENDKQRQDALEALRRRLANLLTTDEMVEDGSPSDSDDAAQTLDRLIKIARHIGE